VGTLLLGSALFFWLLCSGCFRNLSQLLISPMIDFVILLCLVGLCIHYHLWQYEFDKVNLISYFGNVDVFC